MTTTATIHPRCPECGGAMLVEFICYSVDYLRCVNCEYHEFIEFQLRKFPVHEFDQFTQQDIAKKRRFNHA